MRPRPFDTREATEMALTVTRKVGEVIRIGEDIEVTVKEIRKNQVRVQVIAPRCTKIYRDEVWRRIVEERARGKATAADTTTEEDDTASE